MVTMGGPYRLFFEFFKNSYFLAFFGSKLTSGKAERERNEFFFWWEAIFLTFEKSIFFFGGGGQKIFWG